MSTNKPAFPSTAPAPVLISDSGKGDSDSEISPVNGSSAALQHHHYANVNIVPSGIPNDEELETLSIHEQMVDDAMARLPDVAQAAQDRAEPEPLPTTSNSTAYLQSEHGQILQERLTKLVAAFRARSLQAKQLVMQPPPPEGTKPDAATTAPQPQAVAPPPPPLPEPEEKKKSVAPPPPKPPPPPAPAAVIIKIWKVSIRIPEWFYEIPRPRSFDPHDRIYLAWLSLVSVCFLYNAIIIPYRAAFLEPNEIYYWFIGDYLCDLIYLVDLIIWKPSIKTFVNGIEVSNKKEITRKYVLSQDFTLDVCCLIPFDVLYLIPGVNFNPLLRLLRLIKIHSYWEFLDRIDMILPNPYYFRVLRSVAYMMYLIHANACVFYYFSYLKDFNPDDSFVYNNNHPKCRFADKSNPPPKCNTPGDYNAYIFCFFFSVSMVTIIGNLNFPAYISEMIYSTILWFIGVFVFATLVGQIRDVLKAMTRQEDEFYEVMDAIVEHMHTLKIPKELQDRVRTWLLFNWEQQKTIDEGRLLEGLPVKLRTDLAMEVHFSTIHKVQLFKDVDKKVLEELLLRLKPNVYLPNDYICRKGEIGKEMYIIKSGILEVVLPDGRVAVTLSPGSVFGEISLLALAGGNRRTADVRSKGFSNLYVLSKADLNDVMKDYPETLDMLKSKAQELMNKGKPPSEKPPTPPPVEIIPTREPTPEMVRVALSILKPNSAIRRRLSQSAMELTAFREHKPGDSDEEDMEIALVTELDSTDNRYSTPDPIEDVPADLMNMPLASLVAAETPPDRRSDSSSANKHNFRHRRRAVNALDESSSSSDEPGVANAQMRTRRKKHRRGSNHSPPHSLEHVQVNQRPATGTPPKIPAIDSFPLIQLNEGSLDSVTSQSNPKPGSLMNLKRRLFSVPKIFPLAMDHTPGDLELQSNSERRRVFELGPVPANTVGSIAPLNVSYSDLDYAHLSDNFAGVTFSSPESP